MKKNLFFLSLLMVTNLFIVEAKPVQGKRVAGTLAAIYVPRTAWTITGSTEEPGEGAPNGLFTAAIDGDVNTFWHSQWDGVEPPPPHHIDVDMGAAYSVWGFKQLPRQNNSNGQIKGYVLYVKSNVGDPWVQANIGNLPAGSAASTVYFPEVNARYFRFEATSQQVGNPSVSIAEFDMIQAIDVVPTASFVANTTSATPNYAIQLTDTSTDLPTSWSWTAAGGTLSSATAQNPTVSFPAAGTYTIELTATNSAGSDVETKTNYITITSISEVTTADGVPGNAAKLTKAGGDYLNLTGINLSTHSMSFSCWIKPNGIMDDWSAIFMSQDSPSSFGLNFKDLNNTLGYHSSTNYGWSSGSIPSGQWSHVAFTVDATKVTIYINGVPYSKNDSQAAQTFTNVFLGNYGRGYTDRIADFEIDEVCFWNRTLSQEEVRKWRHLTKDKANEQILLGLVAYFQFNETTGAVSGNKINTGATIAYNGAGFTHSASPIPAFSGVSEKINISTTGVKNFSTAGVSMTFPGPGLPMGEVWVSKSTIKPNVLPTDGGSYDFNNYFAINNYGENSSFDALTDITFKGNEFNTSSSNPATYHLHDRAINSDQAWLTPYLTDGNARMGTGAAATISFGVDLSYLTSFGQLTLSADNISLGVKGNVLAKDMPVLYQNPLRVNTPLKVALTSEWENSTIAIYDATGKSVKFSTLKEGLNEVSLNVPAGLYFVKITSLTNTYSSKLIVR
jgi:PKD repeat protein